MGRLLAVLTWLHLAFAHSSAQNPESDTATYSYDNAGNLLTRTDNRAIFTTNSYDALNRLTNTAYSDGTPPVSYAYGTPGNNVANSLGQLISVANGNSVTNYTGFDPMGNVTGSNQQTARQTYSFGYTWNLAGALTSETYPRGGRFLQRTANRHDRIRVQY